MKLPSKYALLLAELHNKCMEVQEEFEDIKNELYDNELRAEFQDYDLEELEEELDYILDQLDTIEADTSKLDCDYNEY